MSDKNKKHGPHGPGCNCSEEGELVAAGIALGTALSEIMPALLARWQNGDSGITIDLRFDRGDEADGIAVRMRPLEEGKGNWPVPGPENTHFIDPSKIMAEAFGLVGDQSESKPLSDEEEYIH